MTTVDINRISDGLLSDLRNRGLTDAQISQSTPDQLFTEVCEWNGLCGWGHELIDILDELREARRRDT